MLEADLSTARTEAVTSRAAPSEKTENALTRQAAVVTRKDGLIAFLQADILKLQRELDSSHCRIVEKEALLAVQASTIDDLQSERDAAMRSAQAHTQVSGILSCITPSLP